MSVRYIFNTAGAYVAFVQNDHLFSPEADWLGFIKNATEVYGKDGSYMGQLLTDDRIARRTGGITPYQLYPPFPPFKPFRPFAPFPRLRMPPLPPGWEDVFENAVVTRLNHSDQTVFQGLLNSELVAADGTFLGTVTKNRFDSNSLANQFGPYGSRYSATSIFNPYSQYGSKYSQYSPFNSYSLTAPAFKKNGAEIGKLSVNRYVMNRVDPEAFFAWFERQ